MRPHGGECAPIQARGASRKSTKWQRVQKFKELQNRPVIYAEKLCFSSLSSVVFVIVSLPFNDTYLVNKKTEHWSLVWWVGHCVWSHIWSSSKWRINCCWRRAALGMNWDATSLCIQPICSFNRVSFVYGIFEFHMLLLRVKLMTSLWRYDILAFAKRLTLSLVSTSVRVRMY